MSSIDLVLLGLLNNQPMSAYELSKLQGIYALVKISTPAIYKNVRRLEKAGFLKSVLRKNGNMPAKRIYSLTKDGKQRFRELLKLCAFNPYNFFFDFNVSLLFIQSIDSRSARKLISSIRTQILEKQRYLEEQLKIYHHLPFPITQLANQHIEINKTLLKWIDEFSKEYDGES